MGGPAAKADLWQLLRIVLTDTRHRQCYCPARGAVLVAACALGLVSKTESKVVLL